MGLCIAFYRQIANFALHSAQNAEAEREDAWLHLLWNQAPFVVLLGIEPKSTL